MKLYDSDYLAAELNGIEVRACDVQSSEVNPERNLVDNIDIKIDGELKYCISILPNKQDSEDIKHYKEALATLFYVITGAEREN
jgi:hypothetical protein